MLGQWQNWFAPAPLDTVAQLSAIALEYPKDELARATNGFSQSVVLGAGNYGAVYKGVMRDGSEVAVKVMEIDEDTSVDSGFADEVKCLSKFRHPNLVTLMGWGKADGQRFIVYELLQGGDVSHRLKGVVKGEPFDWTERLNIARDAASGLSHMHNSSPKAFHRDIKSANILLDRNGTAKMADFGLSLINKPRGGRAMMVEQISGTPGYACPHYIKTGRITEQTEVFAYGMVVLEMMMNTAPACMGQNGTILYPIFQTIMPQVAGAKDRTLMSIDPAANWPPELAGELAGLALTCICMEEAKRHDFVHVLQNLRPMCDRWMSSKHRSSGASASPAGAQGQGYPSRQPPGAPASDTTRPQMGIPGPLSGGGYNDVATRPQLGLAGPSGPYEVASVGFEPRAAAPKTSAKRATGRTPTAADQINLASDPFLIKAPPHDLAEVVLECTYAAGTDVASMPLKHKCLTLKMGDQGPPWAVGRQQQPLYFGRLVPDEALRSCISRNHLEFSWEAPVLSMKKLSQNAILINGTAAPQHAVPLPPGVQISFCPASPEKTPPPPFLVFSVHLRDAAAVAVCGPTALPTRADVPVPDHVLKEMQQKLAQQKQQQMCSPEKQQSQPHSMQMPQTRVAAPMPPPGQAHSQLCLFCTTALAAAGGERDLTALSREMRTISIPPDGRLAVGRAHQQGFFEALLGTDSIFLTFISRLHFELAPASRDHPGALEIKNNSGNPLVVSTQQILKGSSGLLRPPGGIDFLCKSMEGSSQPQIFLRLEALEEAQLQCMANSPPAASLRAVTPEVCLHPASHAREAPVTAPVLSVPSSKAVTPRSMRDAGGGRDGPFWLELGGTALRPEFLRGTARSKRLQGTEDGLAVGRCHQSQLFSEAVKDEAMKFLSREHFKIEPAEAGQFLFLPLSANPMWRVRDGERTSAVTGCSMMLQPGDAILLFTGAPDCTADGPGNQGSLFFRFGDPWMAQDKTLTDPLAGPAGASPSAWASGTASQEPGTGVFNADGTPVMGEAASYNWVKLEEEPHRQAGQNPTPKSRSRTRDAPPPSYNSSHQASTHRDSNALAPPVPVTFQNGLYSEDELQCAQPDLGSLDFEGGGGRDDAFSKSGFGFGR